MLLRFDCPRCRRPISTSEEHRGDQVSCDYCGSRVTVPAAPESPRARVAPKPERKPAKPADEEPEIPLSKPPMSIDHEELIDMTAMVDIVFFLLIFFLVTSMHALDSSIPMPSPDPQQGAGSSPSLMTTDEMEQDSVIVQIDRNDEIQVDGIPIQDERDLLARLRELLSSPNAPRKMLVVGNSEASHGTAVMVLDAGHEAGMEQVRMAISETPLP